MGASAAPDGWWQDFVESSPAPEPAQVDDTPGDLLTEAYELAAS